MVIEARVAVELLEQVPDEVRLEGFDRLADREQLVLHAERLHLVPELAQAVEHVPLGLEVVGLARGRRLDLGGRHVVGVHEHEDPERAALLLAPAHSAMPFGRW